MNRTSQGEKPSEILCLGEALIDMLPATTAEGAAAFQPVAGGAVMNTAVALGRLGVATGFAGPLSRDMFGTLLREHLEASGVDLSAAPLLDRPSTLAFVRLVDGHATYEFRDEETALRHLSPDELPAPDAATPALFAGGISLATEPCGSAIETWLRLHAPGRALILDPNIRPGFIRDPEAFRARLDRLLALGQVLKLSDEDLAWLAGPGTPVDQARSLLARGPAAVFVTRGGDGALAVSRDAVAEVPSQPVTVVDTVGAGDTFNAGLIAALSRRGKLTRTGLESLDEADLRAALELGAAAAAVTVSRRGANPPWQTELDAA